MRGRHELQLLLPVHLVHHLLGQVERLLAALAAALHDLALLVELQQPGLMRPRSIRRYTHHGHPEHDHKSHGGEADHDDRHRPRGEEVLAVELGLGGVLLYAHH